MLREEEGCNFVICVGHMGIDDETAVTANRSIDLLAKVTGRTVPGVVCISQGAWHDADMNGDRVDKGGSINTLTTLRPSPLAKGNPQHTNICQVTKA